MSTSLIELTAQLEWIQRMMTEEPGDEAWEEAFKQVSLDRADKVDNYHGLLEHLRLLEELWSNRLDEDRRMKTGIQRVRDRVKDMLKQAILHGNGNDALGNRYRFKLAVCKAAVEIHDKDLIPPEYFIQVTTLVVDKERVKAALERGESVPGASLEGGYSLRSYPNNRLEGGK